MFATVNAWPEFETIATRESSNALPLTIHNLFFTPVFVSVRSLISEDDFLANE